MLYKVLLLLLLLQREGYVYGQYPIITRGPKVRTVDLGDTVTFYCEAYGDPPPTLSWEINGKPIEENKWIHVTAINGMSILRIDAATSEMEGSYCCSADNGAHLIDERCGSLKVKRAPVITQSPFNMTVAVGKSISLHCLADGYPTPTVFWYYNGKKIGCPLHKDREDCRLQILSARIEDEGTYKCGAQNYLGATFSAPAYLAITVQRKTSLILPPTTESHLSATAQGNLAVTDSMERKYGTSNATSNFESASEDNLYHIHALERGSFVMIVVFLGIFIVISFVAFKLYDRKRLNRSTLNAMKSYQLNSRSRDNLDGTPTLNTMEQLSYPVDKLEIIEELGEGVFGLVFKARAPDLEIPGKTSIVAVKTVRVIDKQDMGRVEDFGREADLLSTFRHDNIIELLGVCFDDDDVSCQRSINCLLFEYVNGGDLCAYLRNCGPNKALFHPPGAPERIHDHPEITDLDKLKMCTDIARGMQYLSERNFIHRDLATRNCLISEGELNVKIADFGLSRRTYESDYYKASDTESVPIRWMAPESILYGKYSSQSDVWAYGVTLWEVHTYALQPYFSKSNEEVICCVCQSKILPPPSNAPPWMYNLMQLCWHRNPEDRPNFATIYSVLEAIRENKGDLPLSQLLPPCRDPDPQTISIPSAYGSIPRSSPVPSHMFDDQDSTRSHYSRSTYASGDMSGRPNRESVI